MRNISYDAFIMNSGKSVTYGNKDTDKKKVSRDKPTHHLYKFEYLLRSTYCHNMACSQLVIAYYRILHRTSNSILYLRPQPS